MSHQKKVLRRATPAIGVAAILLLAALAPWVSSAVAEGARAIPAAAVDEGPAQSNSEVAVLAGGCFWGVQGVFQHVAGVTRAVSGYAGGEASAAHYEMVGTGTTGHAESVQVTFDPRQVSYAELLQVFFTVAHDPTQRNRQGPDVGAQYRSALFYANDAQKRAAEQAIARLSASDAYSGPIVTQVVPLQAFYPAEAYHQDYLAHHPAQPYIVYNDLPKLTALERTFPRLYR